jgi:hypothetical protein
MRDATIARKSRALSHAVHLIHNRCVRRAVIVLLLWASTAGGDTLELRGFLTGRGGYASGPDSWMEGDWGRLDFSGASATAIGELGVDWNPSRYVSAHVHGLARAEPDSFRGRRAGLVAGYLELHNTSEVDRVRLRAGQFFLPTSRENTGDLWSSPYTINFSAINTWMGQEVRPLGADLEWRHTTSGFNSLTVGGTLFKGNDTMGTLLAWRGWTIGNRLPVFDELVPLPPLWSLPVFIPDQNREGTTPFRNDLDGRPGWSARVRFNHTDRGVVQVTHLDNRGDYALYGDEYSWKTTFTHLALELGHPEMTVVAAEVLHGYTGMGTYLDFLPGRPVIAEFNSAYVLVSRKHAAHRFSGRLDWFDLHNEDLSSGEDPTEEGFAVTGTWLYELTANVRTAVEVVHVSGDSNLARESGFDADSGATALVVEARYSWSR